MKREHMPMKVLCLKCFICIDLSNEQIAFEGLYKVVIYWFKSFLSLPLNEFLQSEIKQKSSSLQTITCINATVDKKTISVFCVSGVFCSPRRSAVSLA